MAFGEILSMEGLVTLLSGCNYRTEQVFHQAQAAAVTCVAPVKHRPVSHGKAYAEVGCADGQGQFTFQVTSYHKGRPEGVVIPLTLKPGPAPVQVLDDFSGIGFKYYFRLQPRFQVIQTVDVPVLLLSPACWAQPAATKPAIASADRPKPPVGPFPRKPGGGRHFQTLPGRPA